MSDRPPAGVTEHDVEQVLGAIAASAHTLRCWMWEAGPVIERLAEDYPAAAVLVQSLAVAVADPAHLGTPRHLEEVARAILQDLRSAP